MRPLKVKEIFGPTIQGEGSETGAPAIFVRFSGCNMWNGKPETRAKSACPYCDTDFYGGTSMDAGEILHEVLKLAQGSKYLVVISGGEPLLQDHTELQTLLEILRIEGFQRALETNGTVDAVDLYPLFDFITCSPKVPFDKLKIDKEQVNTWKMLYPHPTISLKPFADYAKENQFTWQKFYLQPIEEGSPAHWDSNTKDAIALVKGLGFPWRLSIQMHKIIGAK